MASRSAFSLSGLVCILAFCGTVPAGPPSSLSSMVTRATLTEAQEKQIEEYANHYLGLLEHGNSEDVMRARAKLIDPMVNMLEGSSTTFRAIYSKDLLPTLERIIDLDDAYRSVNALQVAGFLGTDSTIRMLSRRADSTQETSPEKRLWAVIAIRESINRGDLSNRKISAAIRDLARAAENESEWPVLMRQLETISSVSRIELPGGRGGEELRTLGRQLQLQAVTNTIDRLLAQGNQEDLELLHALRPSILEIRQQYLNPSFNDHRREIGIKAAPQLGRVYEIMLLHFDRLQGNPRLQQVSGLTLRLSEETLKLIDSDLRSGSSLDVDSAGAWSNGQRELIQQHQAAWAAVLGAAPYNER